MTEREAFEAWWATMEEAPNYEGVQKAVAWNAWQARAQPAQAVPVLTDAELDAAEIAGGNSYRRWTMSGPRGQMLLPGDSLQWHIARAIEQAVRAKMGVAVPRKSLTLEQCVTFAKLAGIKFSPAQFSGVLEAEVSEFELQTFANLCIGIMGKEGA